MARGNGSTFAVALPVLEKHGIAAYNWGFVAGKTQTNLPWDSWQKPYTDREPDGLVPRGLPRRRDAVSRRRNRPVEAPHRRAPQGRVTGRGVIAGRCGATPPA